MKRVLRRALGKRGAPDESARRIGLRKVHSDDTFIVSFPKSGNTWVRFLIAYMLNPDEEISFRNIERLVPDIHKSRKSIEVMPSPRFIKCHTPCFDAFPRFVYVLRDGRDAMVSFYHYALGERSFSGSLREFIVSDVAQRYGTWGQHAIGGTEYADNDPARALLIRYEELISSPFEQAGRIAKFCRLNVDATVVSKAVARCRFTRLQEIERRHGGEIEDENEFRFFRRGVQGQWREGPIAKELRPFIHEAEGALSSLGYLG